MYELLRRILFLMPAETAHTLSMSLLRLACAIPFIRTLLKKIFNPSPHPIELWGIRFLNQVGLAAGFDKNAKYLRELETLGFGHVEIGTVTPIAQNGNPKPRLFRLPKDKALINRMGFNNDGVGTVADRLQRWRTSNPRTTLIIGGNIGKNKQTPNAEAWRDYLTCFDRLHPYVNYFTVNVSSPNTPGLRSLQEPEELKKILLALKEANQRIPVPRPILLKLAPDLEIEAMNEVVDLAMSIGLDGLVLANTTLSREGLQTSSTRLKEIGAGGLSGSPLRSRCVGWVNHVNDRTKGKIPLIASGGVFTADDASSLIKEGASLIQVWTGFIYQGPTIARDITANTQ